MSRRRNWRTVSLPSLSCVLETEHQTNTDTGSSSSSSIIGPTEETYPLPYPGRRVRSEGSPTPPQSISNVSFEAISDTLDDKPARSIYASQTADGAPESLSSETKTRPRHFPSLMSHSHFRNYESRAFVSRTGRSAPRARPASTLRGSRPSRPPQSQMSNQIMEEALNRLKHRDEEKQIGLSISESEIFHDFGEHWPFLKGINSEWSLDRLRPIRALHGLIRCWYGYLILILRHFPGSLAPQRLAYRFYYDPEFVVDGLQLLSGLWTILTAMGLVILIFAYAFYGAIAVGPPGHKKVVWQHKNHLDTDTSWIEKKYPEIQPFFWYYLTLVSSLLGTITVFIVLMRHIHGFSSIATEGDRRARCSLRVIPFAFMLNVGAFFTAINFMERLFSKAARNGVIVGYAGEYIGGSG
ncbi:hypothetical protein TWF506_004705 [Arthrobotrys conoides]|uniref:Transmembrane protein n=1 Tax=Arthrobotrys conoides TaxID=74498 RepID=A0AAN8N252_9PEZI